MPRAASASASPALLAERGAKVVVWDRDLAPLEKAAGFKPAGAEVVDIASYAVDRDAPSRPRVDAFGQVDILVNNAGINGPIMPTWDYPLEDWDKVVAIDMTAVFYASRLAARHMREKKYGRIVTIASIAGKEGVPGISRLLGGQGRRHRILEGAGERTDGRRRHRQLHRAGHDRDRV